MKKTIFIICLFFLFSTQLLSKEENILEQIDQLLSKEQKICDWIINSGEYQEYLDDLPSIEKKITNHQIHSAFYVVVGKSGRCSYGWNWRDANSKTIEQVLQDSFNNCEKWRKKDNIEGECKPYDINTKIVWNKPELYKELTKSNIKKPEEKITTPSEEICDWIFSDGKYQHYLYELPKADFHSAFHVVVGSDGRCTFGWQWNYTRKNMKSTRGVQYDTVQGSFNECEKWRKEYEIDGECKPYDIDTETVWNKPEHKILKLLAAHKKLLDEITSKKESEKSIDDDEDDASMYGLRNIINSTDPSTLQKVVYIGEEKRNIVEPLTEREDKSRRFVFKTSTFVFDAYYENGKIFEILIYFKNEANKSKDQSTSLAEEYAFVLGQMPNILLQRLDAAHIFPDIDGVSNACACDRVIAIHPIYEGGYDMGSAIEELFIHELVHASLDKPFYGSYKPMNKIRHKNKNIKTKKVNMGHFRKAIKKDKRKYITDYAKTSPQEDLAESFTAWLALRYKVDRISDRQKLKIENTIPNRIKFFDEQNFDMYPLILSN